MSVQDWIVTGVIAVSLIYLAIRGYRRYKKEARQLQACQSCPAVKERREIDVPTPSPTNSND